MAKSIKDHLQDIFEDLGKDDQRKFKIKLCDRKTEPRVRRAAIEKVEDSLDLSELMVNTFTSTGAVPVAIELLQAIGCNEQATELKENAGKSAPPVPSAGPSAPSAAGPSAPSAAGPSAPSAAGPSAPSAAGQSAPSSEQFIDRNRTKLISRVNNVDAILDELLQMRVITDENYSVIIAERTSQEKMRKLFMGPIKSAGTRGKDALYKALKEVEPFLTDELESQ